MHFIFSVTHEPVDATWILLKYFVTSNEKDFCTWRHVILLLIKLTLKPPFYQSSFLCSWRIPVRSQQVLLMEFTVRKTLLYILGNNLFCCLKRRNYWLQFNLGLLNVYWQLYIIIWSCYLKQYEKELLWYIKWLFATCTPCWDTF